MTWRANENTNVLKKGLSWEENPGFKEYIFFFNAFILHKTLTETQLQTRVRAIYWIWMNTWHLSVCRKFICFITVCFSSQGNVPDRTGWRLTLRRAHPSVLPGEQQRWQISSGWLQLVEQLNELLSILHLNPNLNPNKTWSRSMNKGIRILQTNLDVSWDRLGPPPQFNTVSIHFTMLYNKSHHCEKYTLRTINASFQIQTLV